MLCQTANKYAFLVLELSLACALHSQHMSTDVACERVLPGKANTY